MAVGQSLGIPLFSHCQNLHSYPTTSGHSCALGVSHGKSNVWVGAGAAGLGLTSAAAVLLKKRSRSLVAAAGKAPAQDENFISHAMTHLQTTSGKPVVVSGEL